jgi:uncharacterized protein (TIGR00369 family)
MALAMAAAELQAFLLSDFGQVSQDFAVDHADEDGLTLRLLTHDKHLRPGGTVSGPALFALADVAMYLTILSRIGPKGLTVTTNCSIDFLRKSASGCDVLAKARLLKLGKRLAAGDVLLFSEGQTEPVARAGLTYSIPLG